MKKLRLILYRAKRLDNGEWVYGDLIHTKTKSRGVIAEISTLVMFYGIDPETFGEYTGLTD